MFAHRYIISFNSSILDLSHIVSNIHHSEDLSIEEKCDIIQKKLPLASQEEIEQIEGFTQAQSDCSLWHKARSYRITGSNCHDVMTCMITLQKDPSQKADNLIRGSYIPTFVPLQ